MSYVQHILVLICVYYMLAVGAEIIITRCGIVSLCQGAFYGLGAYTVSLASMKLDCCFPTAWFAGACASAVASLFVSGVAARLHGDVLAIATLGFQMVLFSAFHNLEGVTGGALGISGIPTPALWGWQPLTPGAWLLTSSVCAGLAHLLLRLVAKDHFGRVLSAVRENEVFTRSLGVSPAGYRATAVAFGAGVSGLAGGVYSAYVSYIDPTSFTVGESILILSMALMMGARCLNSPLACAAVIVCLPEAFRFIGLPDAVGSNLRQIASSFVIVVVLLGRRRAAVQPRNVSRSWREIRR